MMFAIDVASGIGASPSSPCLRASAFWRLKCDSICGAAMLAAWYVGLVLIIALLALL
jgi:hypothetical protein